MKVTDPFLSKIQEYCKTFVLKDDQCIAAKKDVDTTSNHYEFLFEVVRRIRPDNVLELGTHWGVSALFMSKACATTKIYTIDNNLHQMPELGKHVFGLPNVEFIRADVTHKDVADRMPNNISVMFVDTDRDIDLMNRQLALYYPKLAPGGYMFWDDILSEKYYPEAVKWWNGLEGYNQMDLPYIHVGYEMGVIIK